MFGKLKGHLSGLSSNVTQTPVLHGDSPTLSVADRPSMKSSTLADPFFPKYILPVIRGANIKIFLEVGWTENGS